MTLRRPIRESDIEAYLVKSVKEADGIAYKFTSPQRRSVPDRLVLIPGGRAVFVECKAPGQRPTDAQRREHRRLRELGFQVQVIDTFAGVDHFIGER